MLLVYQNKREPELLLRLLVTVLLLTTCLNLRIKLLVTQTLLDKLTKRINSKSSKKLCLKVKSLYKINSKARSKYSEILSVTSETLRQEKLLSQTFSKTFASLLLILLPTKLATRTLGT